jgi:hypothetical protein
MQDIYIYIYYMQEEVMLLAREIRTYSFSPPLLGGAAVPGLNPVLRRMLAADKAQRYPDAAAAAEAMEWVARDPDAELCRAMLERRVVPAMRALFLRHWMAREGAPWEDTPEGGRRYLDRELLRNRKAARWLTRERLEAGDSGAWDVTALSTVLLWSQVGIRAAVVAGRYPCCCSRR